MRFKSIYVGQLPIPSISNVLKNQIAALAQGCLDAATSAPESLPALEVDLNALVYQAYGLDESDIAVIEGALAGKSGETVSVMDEVEEKE